MRWRHVADGQQVEIPVLRYDRTVGTHVESITIDGIYGASEVSVDIEKLVCNEKA